MDERTNLLVRTLKVRMDAEAKLFDRLGAEVEHLRDSFQEKSWSSGLAIAQDIERSAGAIEEADCARDEAFTLLRDAMELPREIAFQALLPGLPDQQRGELDESWRSLRMSVVRLKTTTGRMRYAAEALTEALSRVLEGIFPSLKGKIYSRRGTPTGVTGALLVDHKL
jgi:hypothetical protein